MRRRRRTSVTDRARILLRTIPPPSVPPRAPTVLVEKGTIYVVIPGHPGRHTISFGPDDRHDEGTHGRTLFAVTSSMAAAVAEAGKNSVRGWSGFTYDDLRSVVANEIRSNPGWARAVRAQARACVAAARGVPQEEIERSVLADRRRRALNAFRTASRDMAEAGATEEDMFDEVRRAIARQVIRG